MKVLEYNFGDFSEDLDFFKFMNDLETHWNIYHFFETYDSEKSEYLICLLGSGTVFETHACLKSIYSCEIYFSASEMLS